MSASPFPWRIEEKANGGVTWVDVRAADGRLISSQVAMDQKTLEVVRENARLIVEGTKPRAQRDYALPKISQKITGDCELHVSDLAKRWAKFSMGDDPDSRDNCLNTEVAVGFDLLMFGAVMRTAPWDAIKTRDMDDIELQEFFENRSPKNQWVYADGTIVDATDDAEPGHVPPKPS